METLQNFFESLNYLYTKTQPLAAIWLDKSITLGSGDKTSRIAPGAIVSIKNGKLIDYKPELSLRVLMCRGTAVNNLEIDLIDERGNTTTITLN